jgi:hypothetical protein
LGRQSVVVDVRIPAGIIHIAPISIDGTFHPSQVSVPISERRTKWQ